MAIQMRRGLMRDFDPYKMLPGEWAVSIDASTSNQIVWMCFEPGVCKRMGTYEDFVAQIKEATEEVKTEYSEEFNTILNEVKTLSNQVSSNKNTVVSIKTDIQNTYLPQIQKALSDAQSKAESAKNSADTAAISEANAKTSEKNAKSSETAAKNSQTNAAASESNAKTSAANAATSASTATTKATAAANSASSAATSASTATSKATTATQSATKAAQAATAAMTKATDAANYASNAATSATAAEASAVRAETAAATIDIPLPIVSGGTGATTTKEAQCNLLNDMNEVTSSITDQTNFAGAYITPTSKDGVIYKREASTVWHYIESKISSVLGLTATQYNGNSATATKASQDGNGNVISDTYLPKSVILNSQEEIDANTSEENIAGALAVKELKNNIGLVRSGFGAYTFGGYSSDIEPVSVEKGIDTVIPITKKYWVGGGENFYKVDEETGKLIIQKEGLYLFNASFNVKDTEKDTIFRAALHRNNNVPSQNFLTKLREKGVDETFSTPTVILPFSTGDKVWLSILNYSDNPTVVRAAELFITYLGD